MDERECKIRGLNFFCYGGTDREVVLLGDGGLYWCVCWRCTSLDASPCALVY